MTQIKLKVFVKNFNFLKYDFSDSNITDDIVKKLSGCHTVNLSCCTEITDESVEKLSGCHTLYVSDCNQIIDESILTTFGIKSCVVVVLSILVFVIK